MKFSLVFFFLINLNPVFAFETQRFHSATSWIEARQMCTSLGEGWDLPTLSEVKQTYDLFKNYNLLLKRELQSQRTVRSNLIWARSDEEYLNEQFIEKSQVLKIESETLNTDSLAPSIIRTLELKKYVRAMSEGINEISRQVEDQRNLINFLDTYHSTEFGQQYPIDENLPLSMQPDYVIFLPDSILPYEYLVILSKPSLRYIETEIQNVNFELQLFEEGLEVICIKN